MNVSDDCQDALAELFFNYLPAMDEPEMKGLFHAIIRIIEREVAERDVQPSHRIIKAVNEKRPRDQQTT